MVTLGYELCLILCCVAVVYMATRNYEKIDIYSWTILLLLPVVILGYWLQTRVQTPEASVMAFCFIYLDSTILLAVTFFSMLKNFKINTKPWMKILGYSAALGHCALVWLCYGTDMYYSSVEIYESSGATVTKVQSGPLKIVHIIYLAVILMFIIGAIVTAFIKKRACSRRVLCNYAMIAFIGIVIYTAEMIADVDFTMLPYLYTLTEIFIVIDYDYVHMNDISALIYDQQKHNSTKGYLALDMKRRFLSCNERAYEFFPFLKEQRESDFLPGNEKLFSQMIKDFEEDGTRSKKFSVGDITCICEIDAFSAHNNSRRKGYLFELRDATEEQKVIDVMEAYNTTLNAEVKEKTESIAAIQQKIVVGMANIIENRDNNTGGHVNRTSDVVTIMIDEIMKKGKLGIDSQLANDIVRAAPMHDLGKVSIDSNILCKQGKLTKEEFEIMKSHSEKSGDMVKILLDGVEEERFVKVAYNVARYHHERWDGKGYPEGLVGTMIPLEARLMAIADVYDALVSKRCYKEPMRFEKAKEMMCEGMGTQFDPNLKEAFLSCLGKLENYYKKLG